LRRSRSAGEIYLAPTVPWLTGGESDVWRTSAYRSQSNDRCGRTGGPALQHIWRETHRGAPDGRSRLLRVAIEVKEQPVHLRRSRSAGEIYLAPTVPCLTGGESGRWHRICAVAGTAPSARSALLIRCGTCTGWIPLGRPRHAPSLVRRCRALSPIIRTDCCPDTLRWTRRGEPQWYYTGRLR
jgi:hypothetical protein